MATPLSARLQHLSTLLSTPGALADWPADASRCMQRIERLFGEDASQPPTGARQRAELAGQLLNLADVVGALSSNAADLSIAAVTAALGGLQACLISGTALGLEPSSVQRLAAATRFAFTAAPSYLGCCRAAVAGGAAPLDLLVAARTLCVVPCWAATELCRDDVQLAAFASDAAPPALFMPWLEAAAGGLLAAAPDCPDGLLPPDVLYGFARVLQLLHHPAFNQHAVALSHAAAFIKRQALRLLLDQALPVLAAEAEAVQAAGSGWEPFANVLHSVLMLPSIAQQLGDRMQQPGSAQLVGDAARMLRALPLSRHPEACADAFTVTRRGAMHLLSTLCASLCGHVYAARLSARAGGLSTAESRAHCAPPAAAATVAAEQAAAVPAALGALKHAARTLRAAHSLCTPQQALHAAHACSALCHSAQLLLVCGGVQHSIDVWSAAADALLRLLPLCVQLSGASRQLSGISPQLAPAADSLFEAVMPFLHAGAVLIFNTALTAAPAPSGVQLPAVLVCVSPSVAASLGGPKMWQLHSTACRAIHAMAAAAAAPAAPWMDWDRAIDALSALLMLVMQGGGVEASDDNRRHQAAACVAHYAAIRQAASCRGFGETRQPALSPPAAYVVYVITVEALVATAVRCPALVDADFMRLLRWAVDGLRPPAPPDDASFVGTLADLAIRCATIPELAAGLAASGLLGRLVDLASQAAGPQGCHVRAVLVTQLSLKLSSMAHGAVETAEAAPGGAAGVTARLQAAALALQQALQRAGLQAEASRWTGPGSELVQRWPQLLQLAATLGTALQEHWAQPQQAAEGQLALARAAAARSCAYLRCANLTLEGGPAAGEGVGTSRCSACRAVWYCNETCSHADWRGPSGHRRMCRALAAARQQERAAAAAAAQRAQGELQGQAGQA